MDFLSQIVAAKRQRVAADKARQPLDQIRAMAQRTRAAAAPNRFANALRDDSQTNIIAEFKRRSPSKGEINSSAGAEDMAHIYESAGAAAVSVLTEEDYFAGSLADLRRIRETISLPLLRKDFIFDEYQVYESAAAGADALLLIAATLDDETLTGLRAIAEDELGMNALVEVHTKEEMERAISCGARVIGVNNRNLQTFDVAVATSEELARVAPADAILVSESGLTPEAVRKLLVLGYRGFLIGEALMRAKDPGRELRSFVGVRTNANPKSVQVKICGITTIEDARAAIDAGANMLGFNFFRQSPRFVDPETARVIIDRARAATDATGQTVSMIGVFVNESIDEIARIADQVNLDGIQLHGDESAEFCGQLKKLSSHRLLIKAFAATPAIEIQTLGRYPVDSIMIDAFDPKLRGGSGQTADWKVARKAAEGLPRVFLAGGLSPENVGDAIAAVQPDAVDACSSLESSPGKKAAQRMKEFVNAVRASKLHDVPCQSMGGEGN